MSCTQRGNHGRGRSENAASLFPFLAVLLCTMGAMVVLLVAMAHVARDKAEQQAEAQAALAQAADTPEQQLARQRLAEAQTYRDRLGKVRSQAAAQLEEEQTKLTGIEDHIRRLQDEVETLRTEAMELIALEEEHYDDQAMAEQELERLQELTKMLTDEIVELEEQAAGRQRRYAIVPMRDEATGTHRPAVYFECRADGVLLQPEGIKLTREDFLPPVHVSSPLAAAVRTIKQYYADHPEARGVGEAGLPYPLLVVRPDGISAYHAARAVLESINDEYGYQPVAEEWPLEYEAPNPMLAEQVAAAIELARAEREQLAEAAPQLFRRGNAGWAWSHGRRGGGGSSHGSLLGSSQGDGGGDGGSDNPFANVNFGSAGAPGMEEQGGASGYAEGNEAVATGEAPALGSAEEQTEQTAGQYRENSSSQSTAYALGESPSGDASGEGSLGAEQVASSDTVAASPEEGPAEGPAGQGGGSSREAGATASASAQADAQAQAASSQATPSATAGNSSEEGDGEAEEDGRSGIPIRRTIELAVDADQIVFPSGETIEFVGPTRTHAPQVAAALKRHAGSWGIAGQGFYWKPSLILNTAANGQARANELAQLLRGAGIKVSKQPAANTALGQGGQDASQRR